MRRLTRTSAILVISEIALAVLVASGAELLMRSFVALHRLREAFYDAVLSRVASVPGVQSAAAVNALPLAQPV